MHNAEATELKLKSTPTGGVDAERSPYYRRLVSAGYKGYLQGSIGGAGLYGTFGLIVGALVAVPVLMMTAGWGALAIIPIAGTLGGLKGASTFGNIGSVAAINAESADLSEQRRYLLDRYYDLPEGPEGDREANVIRQALASQHDVGKPPPFFHWKTVAIGVAVGIAIAVCAVMWFAPMVTAATTVAAVTVPGTASALAIDSAVVTATAAPGATLASIAAAKAVAIATAVTDAGAATIIGIVHNAIGLSLTPQTAAMLFGIGKAGALGIGALAGALGGSTLGVDRFYVRKWFDHTEGVVHSSSHQESALLERHQLLERMREASQDTATPPAPPRDAAPAITPTIAPLNAVATTTPPATETKPTPPVASLDQPSNMISGAHHIGLTEIQRAMSAPTV